jgi:hypothetical protein
MTLRWMRAGAVAAIVALPPLACDAPNRVSSARQGFCLGPVITDVSVDPVTYHWEDPEHLLEVAAGFGPQTVSLSVATSVQPTVSVTITRPPGSGSSGGGGGGSGSVLSDATLSTSLGYSETTVFKLEASSSVLVPVDGYARLEAYTEFQRSTWGVVGPGCQGLGVSYKPIGVYFKICTVLAGCPFPEGPTSGAPEGATEDAGDASATDDGG